MLIIRVEVLNRVVAKLVIFDKVIIIFALLISKLRVFYHALAYI